MDLRERMREMVEGLPRERLPEAAGALAEAQALLQVRLHENGSAAAPDIRPAARYLRADAVAEMLDVSEKWVYANAEKLGAVKLSPRAIRFPDAAVERYIVARRRT